MPTAGRARALRDAALAVGFYLGLALWCLRVLAPNPAGTIASLVDVPPLWRQVILADQKLVLSVVVDHARTLLHAPLTIFDGPQCFPLRHALMMGHHELAEGALAVVPWVLTRDPVLTYNAVMLLGIALPGIAMHALVRAWTGDVVAAFVAGTMFAVHPGRLGDIVHLSAISNYWTVVSILCLGRFFARPTWPAAFALGLATAAQIFEGIYPLIPHVLIFMTMGVWLAWRHRRALLRLAPQLLVAALLVIASAMLVFTPYLEFKATWGSLAGRQPFLFTVGDLAPGGAAYTGTIALAFAVLALVERLWRRRSGSQPQAALAVAGFLAMWAAVLALPVPGTGVSVPSLFALVGSIVPGFDAFRRAGQAISGWHLAVIVLAGYGIAALLRDRGRVVRTIAGVLLVLLALVEVFDARIARASFGHSLEFQAISVRPPDAVLALFRRMQPGAVVDVPFELGQGRLFRMADFLVAGAYHGQPVAACYNSYKIDIQDDVSRYAARVFTDAGAAEALAALGLPNIVYHLGVPSRAPLPSLSTIPPHLEELGRAGTQVVFRIPAVPPVTMAPEALEVRLERGPTAPGAVTFAVAFRNHAATLYRHPDPIEPTALLVRWYGDDAAPLGEERVMMLWPSALPAGAELGRPLPMTGVIPTSARRLTVATAADPEHALASLTLDQ